MISAADALERLRDGNRRFVAGTSNIETSPDDARRAELIGGQNPFAVIVACSDSRVPVQLIFDQGPGELFIVRVAGNIIAPTQLGSVEYAAAQLGTGLVVVLGHSNCGAVDAAIQDSYSEQAALSPGLRSIVDRIRPAVETLVNPSLHDAVVANVRNSVTRLRRDSSILKGMTDSRQLAIVGAEYSIESGKVTFLDD